MSEIIVKFDFLSDLSFDFIKNIKFLSIISSSALIVLADDNVYGLGSNSSTLGFGDHGDVKVPKLVPTLSKKEIIDFSYGNYFTTALSRNGSFYFWDRDKEREPKLKNIFGGIKVIDIKCGHEHAIILLENGDLYTYSSRNTYGQAGNSDTFLNVFDPKKLNCFDGEKINSISCGYYHSMAVSESGRVFCWGNNLFGQLGVGNTENSNIPQALEINFNVYKIACGKNHNLLLSTEGDIYAFGSNFYGQLGVNKDEKSMTPMRVASNLKYFDIASSCSHNISIAQSNEESFYIWGLCGKKEIHYPEKTNFKSINDISTEYFDETFEILKLEENNNALIEILKCKASFRELRLIACGSFGIVCHVVCKNDGKLYAIKKVPLKEGDIEVYSENLKVFSKINNEGILNYSDYWFERNYVKKSDYKLHWDSKKFIPVRHPILDEKRKFLLHIQTEYFYQNLKKLIKTIYKNENISNIYVINFYIACELFREILEGLKYLHKQNPPILHRNLKTENILITDGTNGKFVKITDICLTKIAEEIVMPQNKFRLKERNQDFEPDIQNIHDVRLDIHSLANIIKELFKIDNTNFYSFISDVVKHKLDYLREIHSMISNYSIRSCDEILSQNFNWALSLYNLNNEFPLEQFNIKDKGETNLEEESFQNYFIRRKLRV